jgi:hypothetical protein
MRALAMRHTAVPTGEREAFRKRADAARSHYAQAGCKYWVFEDDELPGAYVEFFEAPDKATLVRAHSTSKHAPSRLYVEVDLT